MANPARSRRLARLFDPRRKRTVMVPMDDSLLAGPEGGLRRLRDKVIDVAAGEPNAILGFKGLFTRNHSDMIMPSWIVNLTASTTRGAHTRKILVTTVEEAISIGADAVAVHVNISSQYEPEMLGILGEVSRDCERFGLPLMALMYVRAEKGSKDYNYEDIIEMNPAVHCEMVRHAARIGTELGADIIKTQFTGSIDSFSTVVESCQGVPVVIAGGPMVPPLRMLTNAYQAVQAGAAGVCFGRNVSNREHSRSYIQALRKIVHEDQTPASVLSNIP